MDVLFFTAQESEKVRNACEALAITPRFAGDFAQAQACVHGQRFDLILVDSDDEALRGLQFIEWLSTCHLTAFVGVITAKTYREEFTRALRLGISEFLSVRKMTEASFLSQALSAMRQKWERLHELQEFTFGDSSWVRKSPASQALVDQVLILAKIPCPVLLMGEKGTGKSTLACLYKFASGAEFVDFTLEDIADYEQREVMFNAIGQAVSKGKTLGLILFEIQNLTAEMQEFVVEVLLGQQADMPGEWPSRAPLIATTSVDLRERVAEGRFREDLYLLLRQNKLSVPALRDRREDIGPLIDYFSKKFSGYHLYFSQDAYEALLAYDWPGNVGEVKTVMQELAARTHAGMMDARKLPPKILQKSFYRGETGETLVDFTYLEAKKRVLHHFNRTYIADLMEKSGNNLTVAAERAGMDRSNFKKIMKKYGL